MMTEEQETKEVSTLRKLALPTLAGGLVGFLAMMGLDRLFDADWLRAISPSAMIATTVGSFYVIIALFVGGGALSPKFGARLLNVQDAEDLAEQRSILLYSSVAMALWGVALIALALAGPGGVLSSGLAVWLVSATFIAGSLVAVLSYRMSDELMLAVNLEATAVTYALILFGMGGWGMLAHLGFAPVPTPLDWITSFYSLMLAGTFIAAGRRGMLQVK